MSFVRGEKVFFDFDSGTVQPADSAETQQEQEPEPESESQPEGSWNAKPQVGMDFVGDILERAPAAPAPPSAPTFKARPTGFPAHKKRANRVSAFKQQRTGRNEASFTSQDNVAPKPTPTVPGSSVAGEKKEKTEREQIDEENRERLANMTEAEIEQERNELLSALSPALVQKLLARSSINDGSNEQDWEKEASAPPPTDESSAAPAEKKPNTSNKKVSFAQPEQPHTIDEDDTDAIDSAIHNLNHPKPTPQDDQPVPTELDDLPTSMHFPRPPQPPDLDPNSPTFLTDLHQKYFPSLPYDPSTVSWMTPIDPSDKSSPYHPSQLALNASELRFDFKGGLLAPSTAREIPVTSGLHHHSEAPEAAGYTIPELGRLARSAVAAQRCVAYQTLGRILFRLGQGEFGVEKDTKRDIDNPVQVAVDPNAPAQEDEREIADTAEEASSAMATGLWNCVEQCKVIETLTEEAGRERGHLTARTYAQEALWNWRRGGGRKRQAI